MKVDGVVGILAHDAGGARLIGSWVKKNRQRYLYASKGPASPIFLAELDRKNSASLDTTLKTADWILTGTGWQSSYEYDAIRAAKKIGK